ncbi:MAG: phosphate/phosphite/phosphonate ABC transporter substrate-binding protein [Chloroflexi bacterium]|nr:phosphate/phosphite/phosphonate ABC transporter substrate-binding protein [Chloroflexota bacterium]
MGAGDPTELVLGLVPSREADVLVENAEPLVAFLSEALGIPVQGFVPQNYPGLVAAMATGQAHIGAFGPFGLVQAVDEAGAEIVLQSGRDGSVTYHTQWMTNDPDTYCLDEPVANEDGLLFCNGTLEAEEGPIGEEAIALIEDGTTVSFVSETSASGYIFPAVQLVDAEIDHIDGIDPLFADGHDNSVIAVCNGVAPVGVSFNDARTILKEGDCDDLDQVVVFAYSVEIPNDGIAVAGDLSDDLKERITQAFLDYADTEEGQATLDAVYEIDAFSPADLDAFDVVREAAEKVGGSD